MMNRKTSVSIASLITGILFLTTCTPMSCLEETNAFLKTTFYNNITGKVLPPDSLTLFGAGKDSAKLYNKAIKPTKVQFPLDVAAGSSTFIIKINGEVDTITITYSTYPHLISKECGYTFYHTIDTPAFTANIIKQIEIKKNTVTTLNEENIRIFY
jgi:hypothetical protein